MTGSAGEHPPQHAAPQAAAATTSSKVFSTGSRFFQRLERRYQEELALLPEGPPGHQSMEPAYAALLHRGAAPDAALRILRQLVLHRLVELDCDQHASLLTVTHSMTELAEFALDIACG